MTSLPDIFQLGDCEVNTIEGLVRRDEAVIQMAPRAMQVLNYLIEHRDRIVSAEELLERLWPGRVVDESTIHRQISLIRQALGDSAKRPAYVKTFSKRGYQVTAPVHLLPLTESALKQNASSSKPRWRQYLANRPLNRFILAGLLTGLLTALVIRDQTMMTTEAASSVAVIPFSVIAERDGSNHLTEGIVENLLTHLSGYEELSVASRTDSRRLFDDRSTLQAVAERLDVNYLIEGSLQEVGDSQRLTAQLIHANDGYHVVSIEQVIDTVSLDGMDMATRAVAHRMRIHIGEDVRRRHPQLFAEFKGIDLDAVSYYLDSEEQFNTVLMGEGGNAIHALELMEKAVAIDPGFNFAAYELAWNFTHRTNPEISATEASQRAHALLEPIIAKDPDSSNALFYQSQIYILLDLDYERAKQVIDRGVALAPEGRWWTYFRSRIALREGRLNDVLPLLDRSLALDFGEETPSFLIAYSAALYDVGEYRRAIKTTERALEVTQGGVQKAHALVLQAAALVGLGNVDRAKATLETAWASAGDVMPGVFGYAFAMTGQHERARPLLETRNLSRVRGYIAAGFVLLGDFDRALVLLEDGIDDRDPSVLEGLRTSPALSAIRSRPEYSALLSKLVAIERQSSSGKSAASH